MKIADLFCKAGGAAMGYHQYFPDARIVGVDWEPQPHYPFEFIRADVFEWLPDHLHEFDFIHASPICKKNSTMTRGLWKDRLAGHPDQITPLRPILEKSGVPWVMENVVGAPLIDPVMLCGSMFGLKVRRHRLFESNFMILSMPCNHGSQGRVVQVNGHSGGRSRRDGIQFPGVAVWREAMQIDWMNGNELAQAIPPAYTRYLSQFIPV